MGNSCSNSDKIHDISDVRNSYIDSELKTDELYDKINYKLLILGTGESGKSTVVKQLMFLANKKLNQRQIDTYVKGLRFNVIESMYLYLSKIKDLNLIVPLNLELDIETVTQKYSKFDTNSDSTFGAVIKRLYESDLFSSIKSEKHQFWNLETSDFYFKNASRIFGDGYLPTDEDIILCRKKTLGISLIKIKCDPLCWTIVDIGGQKSERRKWITQFDNVAVIIYIVNLVDFNGIAYDTEMNKMSETLEVFQETLRNPCFEKTPLYLIFNKKDLFDNLINNDSGNFKKSFPRYSGKMEFEQCFEYLLSQFQDRIPYKKFKHLIITATIRQDVKEMFKIVQADMLKSDRGKINKSLTTLKGKSSSNFTDY